MTWNHGRPSIRGGRCSGVKEFRGGVQGSGFWIRDAFKVVGLGFLELASR